MSAHDRTLKQKRRAQQALARKRAAERAEVEAAQREQEAAEAWRRFVAIRTGARIDA